MYTLNGWGTALYGSAHREEIDAASTAYAQENGLPPYSFQAVKWFTAAFLPIVPLGIFRVIKVKRGSLPFGSSEYVMEPAPWDWRQVVTHYAVGWSLPLIAIGTLFGLETLDQYSMRRGISSMPLAPFAFVSMVIGGVVFVVWWLTRTPSMRNVSPATSRPSPPSAQVAVESPFASTVGTSSELPITAEVVGTHLPSPSKNSLARRLLMSAIILVTLIASSVMILGCAGGAFLVWRISAKHTAHQSTVQDGRSSERAGGRIGHNETIQKGTRLQIRRREWEDVEVLEDSEFGMVRVQWMESDGRWGRRQMFIPRSQLRWPLR